MSGQSELGRCKGYRLFTKFLTPFNQRFNKTVLVSIIGFNVFLALLIGIYLSISLSHKLSMMVHFAEAFGQGDLTQELSLHGREEVRQSKQVNQSAQAQAELAGKLSELVGRFKV